MQVPYPSEHKDILDALTSGQFVLYTNPLYKILQDHEDFYREFFKASFGFDLQLRSEGFIFLTSEESQENDSRNFLVFLAVMCRELSINGRDFKSDIELRKFHIEEVEQLLAQSSKKDLLDYLLRDGGVAKLLQQWSRRKVVEFTNPVKTQFKFTKAVSLFFEYALELADTRLNRTDISIPNDEDALTMP